MASLVNDIIQIARQVHSKQPTDQQHIRHVKGDQPETHFVLGRAAVEQQDPWGLFLLDSLNLLAGVNVFLQSVQLVILALVFCQQADCFVLNGAWDWTVKILYLKVFGLFLGL